MYLFKMFQNILSFDSLFEQVLFISKPSMLGEVDKKITPEKVYFEKVFIFF